MASEVHRREMAYRRQIDLLRGGFLLIIMGVITGLYPTLSRILAGTSIDNPLGMVGWVALVTMLVGLLGMVATGTMPKFNWSRIRFALIIGPFAGAFPQITLFFASEHVPAIVLSIILAMNSIIVFVVAISIGLERPSLVRFGGLLMGLIAVALVLQPTSAGFGGAPIWILIALIAPLSMALEGILMVAVPSEKTSAWELVFLTMLGSAIWAWTLALFFGLTLPFEQIGQTTAMVIVTYGTISGVATWLFAITIRSTGAVFASQYSYVTTIMGVIWAIMLLSETRPAGSGWRLDVCLSGWFWCGPKTVTRSSPLRR